MRLRALAARARRSALVVVGLCPLEGHCTSERPLSFGARPCCDVPAAVSRTARLRVCAHAIAPLRSLFLGRRRSTRACGPRTPRRAGCTRSVPYKRALHQREASLFRGKTVMQRAGRTARMRVCAHAIAPLRLLSLGRRNTHARGARAQRRAGCSRFMSFGRALHHREASLLRCKAVF